MAELGELNYYASSDNRRIPLETIQRDKERVSHEGQITIRSYWTKSLQSLQTISDHISTHPQYSSESHLSHVQGHYNRNSEWRSPLEQKNSQTILRDNSIEPIQRLAEQTSTHDYTTMISGNNDPCHKLTHCFPYKGPPEAPFRSEISHQQSPAKISIQHRVPIEQRCFGSPFPVVNSNPVPSRSLQVCSEYFKKQTIMNVQSDNVNGIVVLPYKKRKQFFVTMTKDNTGFVAENVLAEGQMGRETFHQDAFIPKESRHEKHVPLKAVAVVTPLAQQAVPSVTLSNNWTKLNKRGHESILDKKDHQPHVVHSVRANESILKFQCNAGRLNVSQETESVLTKLPETTANVVASEPNHSERCSVLLGSVNGETKEPAQSCHMDDHTSTHFLKQNNVTVSNKSSENTETTKRIQSPCKLSSKPINEWSLQRLRTLVTDSEQVEQSQKDIPIVDLTSEIVKLYWNGDDQKLCNAVRSDHYINIMKQASLHSGTENSVILKEMSKEDQAEEDVQFLKPDLAPPRIVNNSSCFMLNDRDNSSHSSLTFCSKPKVASGAVTVEEQKIIEGKVRDQTNTDNAQCGVVSSQARSTKFPTEHGKIHTSVQKAKALVKEPMCMHSENKGSNKHAESLKQKESLMVCLNNRSSFTTVNICKHDIGRATAVELTETERKNKGKYFARETVEQQHLMDCKDKPSSTMTVNHCKNVMNRPATAGLDGAGGEPEDMTLEESPSNEWCSPLSLSKEPSAISAKAAATVLTLPSKSCDNANCTDPFAFVKINILSPAKAKRIFSGELNEKVKNNNISAELFTGSSDHVIVKLPDVMSEHKQHVDAEIKPSEGKNGSDTTGRVNRYCCFSKWFQVLGYENGELCMCEEKGELNPPTEASCKGVRETNESRTAKSSAAFRQYASMDEPKIFDGLSGDEDVPKMRNTVMEKCKDNSLAQCGSHDYAKRKRCSLIHDIQYTPLLSTENGIHGVGEKSKDTTNLQYEKKETIVHLSLYGSHPNKTITGSCMKRKRCRMRPSDEVHRPAETINIIVGSDCSDYSNNRSQITKEQILCTNSQVPLDMFTDSRTSENKESAVELESKIDGADISARKMCSLSAAFDVTGTLLSCKKDIQTSGSESTKNKNVSAANRQHNPYKQSKHKQNSTNWAKIKKQQKKSKSVVSSCEMTRTFHEDTCKSHKGLLLDFRVLPESFRLTHEVPNMTADQTADTKCGPKVKTLTRKKKMDENPGTLCVSPWKRRHFKSAQDSNVSGSSSTFQEFKRRYEQIKQRCT